MLSLQSVQVEQVVPQIAVQPLQTQAEPQKTEKPNGSFLDLLRAEQNTERAETNDVSRVNDEQPVSASAETRAEKPDESPVRETLPQDEKTRVSKKEDRIEQTEARAQDAVDAELVALLGLEQPLMVEENQVPVIYQQEAEAGALFSVDAEMEAVPQNQIGIALNNLSWLYAKSTDADENIPVSDDVIADVLDETAFLLPEITTEDDDLAHVQQLVTEQPAVFLQDAEQFATKTDETADDFSLDGKKNAVKAQKNKPRLEITDLRTQKTDSSVETENAVGKAQAKNGADFAFAQKNEPSVQMTMELAGAASIDQNITSANSQTAAANGSTFQSMLTNAIQENAPDFVKAGNIVLRDGNQGAINLILRPESLGNVKISLSLSDKVITGQITVQSQEAYNAFKDSIDSLKAAFAQSGFEAQGFDLNFAGNQQFAQSQQQEWQNPAFALRADRIYGDLVASEGTSDVAAYAYADYGINIVA